MSDILLKLTVREALGLRRILRREVDRCFERFSGEIVSPSGGAEVFRYMIVLQDAIEEGHELHDKEGATS